MAHKRPVRTRELTSTNGTGDITVLGAANTDNIPFSATMSVGDTAFMIVVSGDGVGWQEFLGTYSATNTIQRTSTITNHLGTTADITLSGSSRVFAEPIPSSWSAFLDQLIGSATNTIPIRGASTWGGISPSSLTALLSAVVGDTGAGGTKGLVPAPAAGDAAAHKMLSAAGDFEAPSFSNLSGITLSSPAAGQVLEYSGSEWINSNRSTGTGWHYPCTMATTGALPACTYSNGTSGVGATLTGNSNGALVTIDGITPVVGYRILVKDQLDGTQNGIYAVTTVGDGSHAFVLTRAADFNDATLINQADVVVVGPFGTVNGSRFMEVVVDAPIVMGTSSFTFQSIGVSYADFTDRGAFDDTGAYSRGDVVAASFRRYLNKQAIAPSGSTLQWDTGYSGAGSWTISGTNHENAAWIGGGNKVLLSAIGATSGKVYFEMALPRMTYTSAERFGLCLASHSAGAQVGASSDGFGIDANSGSGVRWVLNGSLSLNGLARSSVDSQIFGFAVDLDARRAWVQNVSTASGWYGASGAGDPVAGTGGFDFSGVTSGELFPAASDWSDGPASVPVGLNTGVNAFTGTVPSGYQAFDVSELGVVADPSSDAVHWVDIGDDTSVAYSVATLPSAGTAGRRAYVTDANATTFASTVAGGGSNVVPVFDDGTNWIIG